MGIYVTVLSKIIKYAFGHHHTNSSLDMGIYVKVLKTIE